MLFAFVALQLLAALALIISFYVELWPFELLVSFTPLSAALLAVGLTISSILILVLKEFKGNLPLVIITGTAWLAALFILFHAFTAQQPTEVAASDNHTITFATFNKLYSNHDIKRFAEYLKQQNIDILALQEVRPTEVSNIAEQLGFEHTHTSRTFATSGGTSVVLLSRLPFESVETIELATEHPVIRAVVQTPQGSSVVVYSVHIPVPSSPFLYNKRNIVLDSFAKTIQKEELPVIIGGDFNTTVFSPAMRTFSSAVHSSIRPVATERIPACSWYGYGPPLCIRIDHVYIPVSAKITSLTIAPDLGSDHRAIIARIVLQP